MCLFPNPNNNITGLAYRKGITEFDCGSCPECLRKRSNIWALRAVYEAKSHIHNCMITLTYDNFAYDAQGRKIGELPVDRDLHVCKDDIQKFIKRLRKHFSGSQKSDIKYIACAEYGSRTHRAHYHCILFGVDFEDRHYYKKSKRGNVIYMSDTLTKLWNKGICTIDSINVHSAVARYCTKYCAKSRSDDTFMLCSQKIGFDELWKNFNGISYFIDGREYTVPRFIWQHYIMQKYSLDYPFIDYRYVNRSYDLLYDEDYELGKLRNEAYRLVRDSDDLYVHYLDYWQHKGKQFEQNRLPVLNRIYLLDDSKYFRYKVGALKVYDYRHRLYIPLVAPGSNCKTEYFRWCDKNLPVVSRPNRASDTKIKLIENKYGLIPEFRLKNIQEDPFKSDFFI